MYYYYAVVAAYPGIKIWWKKHLTSLQIIQFCVDLTVIYYIMLTMTVLYILILKEDTCQGDYRAAIFGTGLISSYLLLFIDFFYKTYTKPTRAAVDIKKTQ